MSEQAGKRILGRKIGRPLTTDEQERLRGAGSGSCGTYDGSSCNGTIVGPVHSFESGPPGSPTDYVYLCCP